MDERRAVTPAEARKWPEAGPAAVLDSVFEGAGFGLALVDLDMRFVRVNRVLAEINGIRVVEHIGRTVEELLPDQPEPVAQASRRAMETGEPVRDVIVSQPAAEGAGERTFRCAYHPVRAAGEVVGVWASVHEISEERRARAAELHLLRELAQERRILTEVLARAPTGMLLLWGEELRIRYHNARAREELPAREELTDRTLAEALPEAGALAADLRSAVLGRGEAVELDDVALPFGGPGTLDGRRHYSFSAVPVPGDDGLPAGVLLVGRERTDEVRRHRLLERELEDEHRIATQLQVSLMPERLPRLKGVEIASGFHPAGDGSEIGGDFFDVFEMTPDCSMVVIGDVCGKGADAAALTALSRYTLRAAAIAEGGEPRILLGRLNEAIQRQGQESRFVTAICGFVEPSERGGLRVTLAVAGHPLPLHVKRDGSVARVGGQGALLGIWDELRLVEQVVQLAAGERLVLFTDGVLEARAPRGDLSEPALDELVAATASDSAQATVAAIESAVLADGETPGRDDVALLVLRAPLRGADSAL